MTSYIRLSPESQNLYAHKSLARISQRSFLFYIIANVGPGKTHKPLAIAFRQGQGASPGRVSTKALQDRVNHVIQDCVRLVNVLTEPTNRIALEAELCLAASWYQGNDYRDPERAEVQDSPQPAFNFSIYDKRQERPELSWAGRIREFPFISTCLRLSLNRDDTYNTRVGDVQEQHLGTVFRDDRLEYGMVVLDVSDLDRVRYGIVGFEINYMAEVNVTQTGDWDCVEGRPPKQDPVPVLEEHRSRSPLSAAQYMKKFRCFDTKDDIKNLNKRPLVQLKSLDCIWPTTEGALSQARDTPAASSDPPSKDKDILDRAVEILIQDTMGNGRADKRKHIQSISHADFQGRLLGSLQEDPLQLGPSRASADLLRLAYAGHSHLNWVAYKNLSYKFVTIALRSEELKDAAALSLCIDRIGGSPTVLLEALSQSKTIQDVCFLQEPTRTNDDLASQLFAQLCASPSTSSMLQTSKIFLTCAYSTPLRKKFWLPDPRSTSHNGPSYTPPIHAFPVQHMFVRQQFVDLKDNAKKFWPCHFFLGDALLRPERFAVGFLEYCRSVLTDRYLFGFASAPPDLRSYKKKSPGLAISPISAQNFAIPGQCSITRTGSGEAPDHQRECWPLVRVLESGSWAVIVSHEWSTGVPYLRYAFIRARQRIVVPDDIPASPGRLEGLVRPEYVEVVGAVSEFLQETACEVDTALLDRPMNETVRILKARWPSELAADMSHISVLDDGEARSILRDFLEDAAFVTESLRLAMQVNPEECNWYPELLETYDAQRKQHRARNTAIFKSLLDPDIKGEHPLGTERMVYAEDSDYDDL
ncbi:hypothetical protein DL764_000455 [Monosporascus ibericus]|uniref:Uncharacterized protein n=1 Tax=Monosporascus ibericus TaxID=155417 RepID=A0A4V1XCS4_9PEZI|nr:hypothetical protein DL764_000455 [Monosporascus ibericus]